MEDEYLDIFISELDENVKILNDSLRILEKDSNNVDAMNEVMRAAHTVKGMAGTMGYENLAKLTHVTESKILELIEQKIITKEIIRALYQVADRMQDFAQYLENGDDITKIQVDDLIKYLESYDPSSASSQLESTITEEETIKLSTKFKIKVIFNKNTSLRGARGFQLLRAIEQVATIEDSVPPRSIIEEGKLIDDPEFDVVTIEDEFKLREAVGSVADVDKVEITHLVEDVASGIPIVTVQRGIQSVRVNLNQLDSVVDLLGELILAKIRLEASISDVITPEAVEQLNIFESTISTIQDRLMGMRMVSLSRIFDNFPRTVRDVANQRGIEIELIVQGSHIELDRSVIDQVNEALLHLIRNAAIHGIEDPKDRRKLKKPEKGKIRVSAVQDRGEVVFNVEDDGSGLDLDRIRQVGIERGLITEDVVLTRKQVAALIFHPGFSTAKELTSAAGRGVGMDIVKSTIDEINGSIEVRSRKGKGTLFVIRVPQTLAIIQALVVNVNNYLFAIPLLNIEKIYSLKDPAVIINEDGSMYVEIEDNRVVGVRDLERSLIIPDMMRQYYMGVSKSNRKSKPKLILWEKGGQRTCLKVTDILDQREIVTKQLDSIAQQFRGFSGATILDEDRVVLILDPSSI